MVSKKRAAAAVRAVARSDEELGELLGLLDNLADQELAQWLITDQDCDGTIWAFIRAKAQGAVAGPGPGSTAAGGAAAGLGVRSTACAGLGAAASQAAAKRERTVSRYLVTDVGGRRALTPLASRVLVTYAHGSHGSWRVGQELDVLVIDGASDKQHKQRRVKASVLGIHSRWDVIFCATAEPIEAPDLDFSVRAGEWYLQLGCSNMSQEEKPYSISHGVISTTLPDKYDRIRGDAPSLPGQSGGGCFSAETGKLIAINLAADAQHGSRATLLTVASLRMLLRIRHLEEVRALNMPDFVLCGDDPTDQVQYRVASE